jgi:hypothetical protein
MRFMVRSVLPFVVLGVVACGEKGKPEGTPPSGGYSSRPAAKETPPPAPAASPAELGQAAGTVYLDTLKAVVEAMKGDPAPADLRAKLEALKAAAIPRLVEIGRKREALDAAGKASVDSAIGMSLNTVPGDVFTAYSKGQSAYQAKDADLGNLITSFNILTQYANFELLKKQAPEEAKRLGIP